MDKKNLKHMKNFRQLREYDALIVEYLLEHNKLITMNYSELAKVLGKDKSNIRKAVKRLEEMELVVVRYKDEYAKIKQMAALKLVSDWEEKL